MVVTVGAATAQTTSQLEWRVCKAQITQTATRDDDEGEKHKSCRPVWFLQREREKRVESSRRGRDDWRDFTSHVATRPGPVAALPATVIAEKSTSPANQRPADSNCPLLLWRSKGRAT